MGRAAERRHGSYEQAKEVVVESDDGDEDEQGDEFGHLSSDQEEMEDLCAHDGGPSASARTPQAVRVVARKAPASRSRRQKAPAPVVSCTSEMPRFAPSVRAESRETVEVPLLSDGRNIWMRMDMLPWFLQYMRDEWCSGGVRAPPKQRTEEPADGITWDFRDHAWQGHAKDRPVQARACVFPDVRASVLRCSAFLSCVCRCFAWVGFLWGGCV